MAQLVSKTYGALEAGYKVLMYNPETDDVILTSMKLNNPQFNKKFEGYKPLCIAKGFNTKIIKFTNKN